MPLASVDAVHVTPICVDDPTTATAATFVGTEGGVVSFACAAGVVALTGPDCIDTFGVVARS